MSQPENEPKELLDEEDVEDEEVIPEDYFEEEDADAYKDNLEDR